MCLAFVKAFHVNQGPPLGVVMVVNKTVFPWCINLVTIARRRSVLPVARIANSSTYLVLFKLGFYMAMHIIKQDIFLVLAYSYFNYKQSNEHVYTLDHCVEAQTSMLLMSLNQTTTLFVTGT